MSTPGGAHYAFSSTVADNLLVRPLPYRNASQLVMLWERNRTSFDDRNVVSPGNYLDWRTQNRSLDGIAALREARAVLLHDGRVEELGQQRVSTDFFPLPGIQPVRGRLFTAEEDRPANSNDPILLISHRLWRSCFGGDPNIVGRKVLVNSVPRTIIGVLPPNFYFLNRDVDLWEPLGLDPARDYRQTSGRWMLCLGRRKSGVTLSQAQADLTAVAKRLEQAYPVFDTTWTVRVEPLRDALLGATKAPLLVLLAAVVMMLTVACANVANLLLARYRSRQREMTVRASLGAGRWRVIRQLLTESILLALALSILTGILFGLAPAMLTSRLNLTGALRGDSRSGLGAGASLRSWLVGAEVALSVVLLAGAMLLFRSLVGLQTM